MAINPEDACLDEGEVLLDLHSLGGPELLESVGEVRLAGAPHVEVDHEQRACGLLAPPPRVLTAFHLTIPLHTAIPPP